VLNPGWNWTSFNIDLQQNATGVINNVMTAAEPWSEGDLMKNPYTRNFCVYSDSLGYFTGSLYHFYYIWMHMIYSKNGNIMRVYGNTLPEDSMHIMLNGDGAWNAFPCLLKETTSVTEALSDYYTYATPGDMLKSHDHFAVFSQDKRWEGDLTAIRPGEGYMFRRLGSGSVNVKFFNKPASNAPRMAHNPSTETAKRYATNMTMIAKLSNEQMVNDKMVNIMAYIGDELVGVANPYIIHNTSNIDEVIYFLTISSDQDGAPLRFRTEDGQWLNAQINEPMVNEQMVNYVPDAHHGSLMSPILLRLDDDRPYKILENNHVIIIRNHEKYDVTGKKL
jgi:hypothetical protein